MKNKQLKTKEWCSYKPAKLDENLLGKRFRCPVCKKRFIVFLYPNGCGLPCCEYPTISRHKRTIPSGNIIVKERSDYSSNT